VDDGSEWRQRRSTGTLRQPEATALHTYLLDADDELAEQFDLRTRLAVRQGTTVKVLEAPVGECDLEPLLSAVGAGLGLLVLDGLLAYETRVGERTATELIGAGDLLQPGADGTDAMLERTDSWRALWATKLGLLDAEFVERARPWPQILQSLLRRASRRAADIDALRAITCHPRLEVRLDLVFWHLAARWGRVEPAGIRLTLPLTHRLLGQLVAAERPSISHALARLAHAGLVVGTPGDWHLVGSPEDHLSSLIERPVRLTPRARGIGPGPHGIGPAQIGLQ
jgi:CRP/FNR family transcriptional regulator, cyclic AMP receptor protein